MKKIKLDKGICSNCKYRMGFGSNANCTTRSNFACNYLEITGHSRIFEDGELRMDPQYCDKYEEGRKITDFADFTIAPPNEVDEWILYKMEKIKKERRGQKGGNYYNKPRSAKRSTGKNV